jgi:serine/threonine protein kinase
MSVAVDNESRARTRVGEVLKDKWHLDALLGVGGMAAVYSATHRNQKRVAIKMLLPEFAGDREVRDRFIREGYAANTIEHPGALSVLDDDVSEDGQPFLVMELLEGETVEARWERSGGRVELPDVLAIAAAMLDVLAVAHTKGVVHRDIKPENLFLVRGGGLKVLDFGIARVLEGTRSRTETRAGTVMGTPAFMAPEQALAKWDEVDGRTDLWAVGATMFTLLSGQHVHEGANGNEQFVKSATQAARSVASCTKGLPRSVIALVDRALKFDRNARWPDARAMQDAVSGAYEALTGSPLVIEAPNSGQISGQQVTSGVIERPSSRTGSGSFSGPTAVAAGSGPTRRSSGEIAAPVSARGKPPPPPPPRRSGGAFGQAPPLPPPRRTTSGTLPGASERRVAAAPRASGSFEAADPSIMDMGSGGASRGLAPPTMDALGVDAYVAGRTAERDAAVADVARFQPIVAEIQGRLAGVRRRVAQSQEQIAAARKERAAEDEKFRRQMNARQEGVGEARKAYRRTMGEVARIALEDGTNFPPSTTAADRVAIEKTAAAAEVRARESALHQAALGSYDPKALQAGIGLVTAAVVVFLLLFFSPILMRSCSSDTGTITTTTSP